MGVKAVFFDIDGTLLTDNRTVSKSTIFAIQALRKQGILVGLATGRSPRFLLPYMAALSLDFAIAYNGQYIFSRSETLFAQELPREDILDVIDYAKEHKKDLSFGAATGVIGSGIMNFGSGNFAYRVTRLIPENWAGMVNFIFNRLIRLLSPQKSVNMRSLLTQPIYQMMLLVTLNETKKLEKQFPHLSFTRSSPYAADVLTKGMSKLKGIEYLADHYGFTTEEVMVFGDSQNDLEMLMGVRYSVAMGNAGKKVRQSASYVTATNNRDGIYKAMQHFGLVGEEQHA